MTAKNLNIRVSEKEWEVLKRYCQKEQRSKTDVLREFIRSLEAEVD